MVTARIETVDALLDRVLSPQEPQIDLARAVTRGSSSAEDGWEACLADGLVPISWASDDKRVFGTWVNTISNVPPSLEAVVRIAANVEAMLAAEMLARSAMRATEPWTSGESPSAEAVIEWRFFSYNQRGSFDLDTIDRVPAKLRDEHARAISVYRDGIEGRLARSGRVRWDKARFAGIGLAPTFYRAVRALLCEQEWAALAEMGAMLVAGPASARSRPTKRGRRSPDQAAPATGARFDQLENPWAARAALWELGFVLLDAGRERIVLLSTTAE